MSNGSESKEDDDSHDGTSRSAPMEPRIIGLRSAARSVQRDFKRDIKEDSLRSALGQTQDRQARAARGGLGRGLSRRVLAQALRGLGLLGL